MTLDDPADDEVLALRFDEPAAAQDLAAWCGGSVELAELPDGGMEPRIWVPTVKGPKLLLPGMWVKQLSDGTHDIDTAEDFAARHLPA